MPHTYALTGPNGEDLSEVPGLSFDPDTRVLSGTPTRAGATTVTYRATNNSVTPPLTHTATFRIVVAEAAPMPPTVEVAAGTTPVTEGTAATFTVTRTVVTEGALTVNYSVSESGGDRVTGANEGDKTIDFSGNATSVTITVPVESDDSVHEADSVVTVTLTVDDAYEIGTDATADVTVEDNDDSATTGTVTVTGTPKEGRTLAADTSGLSDGDGLDNAAYAYQWVRTPNGGSDADIAGAISETYVPTSADVGATLKVKVTVTDDEGHRATLTSAPTSAVAGRPKVTLSLDQTSIGENGGVSTLTARLDRMSSADTVVTVSVLPVPPATVSDYTLTPQVEVLELTIPANSTASTETATITARDNNVDAPNKTLAVSATAANENEEGVTGPDDVTLTITDDENAPTVTLDLDPDSIAENGGVSTVTASLDHPSSEATTLTVSVAPVAPTTTSHYRLSANRELTIPAGGTDSAGVVTITARDNRLYLGDRTATVSAAARNSQGITAPQPVTLTITEDELAPLFLSVGDASVNEGDVGSVTMTFTVTLTRMSVGVVTVDWATDDGTATAGDDYTQSSGTLTFNAGETSKTLTVPVLGDTDHEPNETFTVALSNPVGSPIEDDTGTGTIVNDDDPPPSVSVAPVASPVTEGEPAQFTVTRTGVTTGALTVNYRVSESGGDRVTGANEGDKTVDFSGDADSVTITVPTVSDNDHEADSTVTVTLTADAAYEIGTAAATVTVEDDDDSATTGTVTITGTPTEGRTLTADISGLSDADGLDSADYAYQWVRTSDGSDTDIVGATSQTYAPVLADAGATLKVKVTVTDDEGHEATLTSAPTAAVTALPRLTVAPGTTPVTEGVAATFTVTRTVVTTGVLTVSYSVSESEDMVAAGEEGEKTIAFADDATTVTVPTEDDSARERASTVTVTLTEDAAYVVGTDPSAAVTVEDGDNSPPTGTAALEDTTPVVGGTMEVDPSTIGDPDGVATAFSVRWFRVASDGAETEVGTGATYRVTAADAGARLKARVSYTDGFGTVETVDSALSEVVPGTPLPSVSVVPGTTPVKEGTAATFTVSRTGVTTGALTVSYSVSESGAMVAASEEGAKSVDFGASDTEVTVPTVGDSAHEAHSTVTLALEADAAYELGADDTAEVTVLDDDNGAPTGALSIDDTTPVVGETLTVDPSGIGDPDGLTGATYAYRWVRVASGGAETQVGTGALYVAAAGDVGSRLKVEASFTDDGGTGETVESAVTAVVEAASSRLSIGDASVDEGDSGDTTTLQFTVTLNPASSGPVTVDWSTADGTAEAGRDYTAGNGRLTFGAGETGRTVSVSVTGDEVDEPNETFTVTLSSPLGATIKDGTATGTITDDEDAPAVTLVLAPDAIAEDGGVSTVTARLDRPSSEATTVSVSVTPVSPAVAGDYTLSANLELTVAAGETESTGEVTVTAVDNAVDAPDKVVPVSGTATNDQGITAPEAVTLAITDDDLIDGRQRRLEYALASFGRTVVQDPVTAVEDRPESAAAGTTATLAGTPLGSFRSEEGVYGALQRHVGPDGERVGTAALGELLSRSSFQLSLGDEDAGEVDGTGAGSLMLWGRGSQSWSEGRLDPAVATRGEVLSGQLGLELRVREDTLLGVMLSGSAGEVEFDGALETEVETELVGVHPYVQWTPRQGLRTWAMLGYGAGEATLTDSFTAPTGTGIETGIDMRMAAAGGSHEVASLWGIDWSVGTSGFLVQLDADEQAGLPALSSEVWQVRLLLEGSAGEDFGGVSGLRGNVELAARVDGGDAETGVGMELGGGVGYGRADLGIEVEASGRMLLSHEEEGLEEAGVSLALRVDPGEPGRALYFALAPTWGNAASGARAMWEDRQAVAVGSGGADRFEPRMRLSSELGYTVPTPTWRGTLTTYGAFTTDGGATRQYRVGRRLELGILSVGVEAERIESTGATPGHGIWLRGNLRF